LSIIEPKLIDNATISTGGFTAVYGDKTSSITQLKLKSPSTDKFNADVSLDFAGLSASAGGAITDDISIMVAGRRGILNGL